MLQRLLATATRLAGRTVPLLLLVTASIASTFQPPATASADPQPPVSPQETPMSVAPDPGPKPAALLQLVIHQVHIRDDRDLFGAGEELLTVRFWRCPGPSPEACFASGTPGPVEVVGWEYSFNASSGETVALERVLPLEADVRDSTAASEETGIAVYDGQSYLLEFRMQDRDPLGESDNMGVVQQTVTASNDWGIGQYTAVLSGPDPHVFCTPGTCPKGGDFEITFDVRRTPLPDLAPTGIRLAQPWHPGSNDVCLGVENRGQKSAAVFEANLRLDGTLLPTGYATGANLNPGDSTELCVKVELPAGGHQLQVTVDEPQTVREQDESNNQLEQTFLFRTQIDTSVVSPGSGVVNVAPDRRSFPDLSVTEIRIQGSASSGGSDCNAGKNSVVITVADPDGIDRFLVRLVVDHHDDQAYDVMAAAARTQTSDTSVLRIPFTEITLNRGDHTLTASVDPDNTVVEANEGNNTLTVQVHCGGE